MLTLELDNTVFGRDTTPGLLACSLSEDGRSITRYRRGAAATLSDTVPFTPFLLLADEKALTGARGVVSLSRLDGPGQLGRLAAFETWRDAMAARDRCRAAGAAHRFFADPVQQYLLLSGCTLFGGLRFSDLRRLSLDIEVITSEGFEFPSASRPGDRIVAIALSDTTGWVEVLRGDRMSEPDLLLECGRLIRERDPDVVEGHNIFRFDLEYLDARARLHGVALAWGRDASGLRGSPSQLQIAERTIAYRRYALAGRHIVDTWILAQLHDAGARDLPSFGLKDLARHLGIVAADRTYVDGGAVSEVFREDPDRLMAYAADDVRETLAVAAVFAPPYFAQAQLVPFDYQATVLRGAAAKIDGLLLREYLRRGQAVPWPRPPALVGGGHVAVFQQGVARPALHVDVTSLYPSLMLASGIAPASDSLGVFLPLLRTLRNFRVRAKREAMEARDADERAHLMALQQSFKILINAFFGYLAFSNGHWNDYDAANRVTAEGRDVVTAIIERLGALGAVPLEADTDGVYFVPPPGEAGDPEAWLARIATSLPAGIELELDGRYAAMLSYKAKTYALLDRSGRVTLKGSAFRSRGLEPFQRAIIAEVVGLLLVERGGEARVVIDRWLDDFAAHRVEPRTFARTETLQDTLDRYRERVAAGARATSAAYELALASGRAWAPGDQISYYVAGRGARVPVNEYARLVTEWNPARPDENVEYYQMKILELWERFKPFAENPGLRPYVEESPEPDRQLSLF